MSFCFNYSNPKSFVNFLLPPQGIGEGWGGVKILRLLQGLLYIGEKPHAEFSQHKLLKNFCH